MEIHLDAIQPGQRVIIVDDLLASGGTMQATVQLVRQLGGGATLEGKHLSDLLQARAAYLKKAGRRVHWANGANGANGASAAHS